MTPPRHDLRARPPRRLPAIAATALVLPLLLLLTAAADSKPSGKATPAAPHTESLTQLLASSTLKGADVGVHVVRLSDGKTMYARQPDQLFIPASNAKLLTTAAALVELGPDYEFRTVLGSSGRDLVVVGGGDPTIGGRFTDGDPTIYFRRWAAVLRSQQLTRFAGDLIVDDSFFDTEFVHPHWPKKDLGHWYAAPIGALALNDDCVDVRIAPGPKPDSPGTISLVPNTRYFSIDNRTRTATTVKAHAPRVDRRPGTREIQCAGGVYQRAQPQVSWVAVDDPGIFFGSVLREVLAEEGVTVAGSVRRVVGAGASAEFRPRVRHRFRLAPALAVTNKESQNFFAEQILKTLGAEHGDGSWPAGRRAATEALMRLGLDPVSFVIDDGCGLSRENRVSPRCLTALLAHLQRGEYADLFRESLAIAGVDGTLARRIADDSYRGRIWAKTGSITGVRAISGYARTRDGEWLAFSFLANNVRYSIRDVQDQFCKQLVDLTER